MGYNLPVTLGPILPRRRRIILRIILALEALGCSLQIHTRGFLIPVDIIDKLGLYNGIMTSFTFFGILAVLTWLLLYYWDWIWCDYNQWEFRQSIPELEHAIKALTSQSIELEKSEGFQSVFLPPEDSLRVNILFAKLNRMDFMDLSSMSKETQIKELTRILYCARNRTYKDCRKMPF